MIWVPFGSGEVSGVRLVAGNPCEFRSTSMSFGSDFPTWLCHGLFLQLAATDVSAQTSMKDAAKCDKHCEMQNSVNQQKFERILRRRDIPGSMPTSASIFFFLHLLPGGGVVSDLFVKESLALFLSNMMIVSARLLNLRLRLTIFWFIVVRSRSALAAAFFTRHEVRSANPPNLSI